MGHTLVYKRQLQKSLGHQFLSDPAGKTSTPLLAVEVSKLSRGLYEQFFSM